MKFLALTLSALISASVFADGEANKLLCIGNTKAGQTVSLEACFTGETNAQGRYEVIPCNNGSDENYVTLQRAKNIDKNWLDMNEIVQLPGQLFSVDWADRGFFLTMDHPAAGKVSVTILVGKNVSQFSISTPTLKHSFKNADCTLKSDD